MSGITVRRSIAASIIAAATLAALFTPALANAADVTSTTDIAGSPASGSSLTAAANTQLTTNLVCEPGMNGGPSSNHVELMVYPGDYSSDYGGRLAKDPGWSRIDVVGGAIATSQLKRQFPVNADGTVPPISGAFPVSDDPTVAWSTPLASALSEGQYSVLAVCSGPDRRFTYTDDPGDGDGAGVRMAWANLTVDAAGGWKISRHSTQVAVAATSTLSADNKAQLTVTATAKGAPVPEGTIEVYWTGKDPVTATGTKIGSAVLPATGVVTITTPALTATSGIGGLGVNAFRLIYVPASASYVAPSSTPSIIVTVLPDSATSLKATLNSDSTVTLDAAVVSADKPVAAGTVQFFEGTVAIGDPITVSKDGKAGAKTKVLLPGPHTFTAVFTPVKDAKLKGSTSSPAAVTVAGAPVAEGTSLTIAAVPSVSTQGVLTIGLGAVVFQDGKSVADAAGTVQFTRDGKSVGTPVVVSGGTAALRDSDVKFDTTYQYRATFTPSDGSPLMKADSQPVSTQTKSATLIANGATIASGTFYRVVAPDNTFVPNETVSGVIRSTPTNIGSTSATTAGGVDFTFTAPRDLEAGNHQITLTGAGGKTFTVAVSVANTASNKPAGFATDWVAQLQQNPAGIGVLLVAVLVLAAGGVVGWNVFWHRRRRATRTAL